MKRTIFTLLLACYSLKAVASTSRRLETTEEILERSLAGIGLQPNNSEVRNVKISGSQHRTRSIITTIALDTMDQMPFLMGAKLSPIPTKQAQ
jgi:hypothetical protein